MATDPKSAPVKKPRLFMKEMVTQNFKSYAGEQRVGPFHKNFSAVVVTNGSGKSNVMDAMLFLFGMEAKQMRLNKVSELIHNSTNHQDLNSAHVSVHFHEIIDLDDGTYKAVPGSDFVIARAAFRDNSSKYYINGHDSKFTEVSDKLKGKGVDLDNNRFLILQEEVEQISLMTSTTAEDKVFLEYLEDIIGTNKRLEKMVESSKKLESLKEKSCRLVQMVGLTNEETESLQSARKGYKLLSLLRREERAAEFADDDNATKMEEIRMTISGVEENRKKLQETKVARPQNKHTKTKRQEAAGIAFGGNKFHRVETPDGFVIDETGIMSGGGNMPLGATGISGDAVAKSENELTEVAEKSRNVRRRISEVVRNDKDLEKTARDHKMRLAEEQMEEPDIMMFKEMEMKGKGYTKKHDDSNIALSKHMEQVKKEKLLEELNSVNKEHEETVKQYCEWRVKRHMEFMAGLETISSKLKEVYQRIAVGGDAELVVRPFEGVVFRVMPPKKSWNDIAELSRDEKIQMTFQLWGVMLKIIQRRHRLS